MWRAGYLGSHISKDLTKKGYRTWIFEKLISSHWGHVESGV